MEPRPFKAGEMSKGYVLSDNKAMLSLCRQLGFKVCWLTAEGMYQLRMDHLPAYAYGRSQPLA